MFNEPCSRNFLPITIELTLPLFLTVVFFDEALRVCADCHSDYRMATRIFNIFQKHSSMYLNIFRESNI